MLFKLASSVRKVWKGNRLLTCLTESIGHHQPCSCQRCSEGLRLCESNPMVWLAVRRDHAQQIGITDQEIHARLMQEYAEAARNAFRNTTYNMSRDAWLNLDPQQRADLAAKYPEVAEYWKDRTRA